MLGGQLYQKEMPTQGFLHKYFPAGYEHEFEHLCETASEIMSKKEFVI